MEERTHWWTWFYTKEELKGTLQNFQNDTDFVKRLRCFFLATNLVLFAMFL